MEKAEEKICENCNQGFIVEPDDFLFYKKINVPTPDECPRCRQQQRMAFRNFKTLYKRKSDKSGKDIISMYPENTPFPVWSLEEWWADDWDSREYGRDFDFSRPFFEQYQELVNVVPRFAVMSTNTINSQYTNMSLNSKNCYLVFGCVDDEECVYGHIVWESKDCIDCLYVYKSELCYECVDVINSYKVLYSQECEDCADSIGLYDCKGCTNCIGCVGLRQKSYHIFNEDVGKERYEAFLKFHLLHKPETMQMIQERVHELKKQIPQKNFFGSHNTDVSGNHIYNGNDMHNVFDVKGGEHSRYVYTGRNIVDSLDISFTVDVENGYQSLNSGKSSNIMFSEICTGSDHVWYSRACSNISHAFGCAGCKGMKYVILNKQYSEDEFHKLKDKIIEHMKETGEYGKFFPKSMTPFGYNATIAQEYIELSQAEIESKGYRWEEDIPRTSGKGTKKYEDLPDNPKDYPDTLTQEVLTCDTCSFNYRLVPQEMRFYKHFGLTIPKECFNCRHARRMASRNPRVLVDGNCKKCDSEFKTSVPAEEQKKYPLYCEKCYQSEIL